MRRATASNRTERPRRHISIHALLAESDHFVTLSALASKQFLSTLSLRRATTVQHTQIDKLDNFYPRSPCGERRKVEQTFGKKTSISIHALLAESDKSLFTSVVSSADFYPRSPCGERPYYMQWDITDTVISIHALLAESDSRPKTLKSRRIVFLSTLSLRRATNGHG